MTTKAAFDAEQWQRIVRAPALAGLYVAAAGKGGTLRESLSMARAYTSARKEEGSELLQELVTSPPSLDPKEMPRTPEELRGLALAALEEAKGLLGDKASAEEAADYRAFVLDVAGDVARAHKEGGFLGVGGQEVSEAEQAALDEIERTLEGPAA
jgi:hypothetical protein